METFVSAIRTVNKQRAVTSEGVVTKINGTTCTVDRGDRAPLEDVRLHALEQDCENHILIVPKVGSTVLVIEIENQPAETAIIKYTDIDKVEIKINKAEFCLEKGKIRIKNKEANLLKSLTDLTKELAKAIIQTPSGPGSFSPANILKFNEINADINKLLF
jgi:hypothetical protein